MVNEDSSFSDAVTTLLNFIVSVATNNPVFLVQTLNIYQSFSLA